MPTPLDRLALRAALAFIWLATGLAVLHPYYRQLGEQALAERGLPAWLMYAACTFEVLLGLRVLLDPAAGWLALLQAAMIVGFTIVLAVPKPQMLYDPYGVLTKNVPLLALVGTSWLVEREGWSRRAVRVLRVGMASIWLLEGLLPNLIFHAPEQRQVLAESGLVFGDLDTMMFAAGIAQIASFFAVLLLWGWPLRLLLALQALGLVVVCVLVTRHEPLLWFHPFGPLTKNVSILIGTLVVVRVVR